MALGIVNVPGITRRDLDEINDSMNNIELLKITHDLGGYPQVLLGKLQHGLGLEALGDNPIGASDVTQIPARAIYHDSQSLTIRTAQSIVQLGTNPELHQKNDQEYFVTWPDNQLDSLYIRLI